jgi:hypothetical protein
MAAFLQDQERPLLCIATDQVEDHIDFLSQNLLELRLSITDKPAGSDGFEVPPSSPPPLSPAAGEQSIEKMPLVAGYGNSSEFKPFGTVITASIGD